MKNKKIIFGVLSGVAAFSTVLALGNVNQTTGFVSAEECGHTGTVEHYLANATTIEHWACCDCHTAWADEAKTIVVRTVDKDQTRSSTKIQFANYYVGGEYGWEDNSIALYDATYGFAYQHTLTQAANQLFAEFYDTTLDFVTNTSYQLEVTNDTDAFLQARLLNADWNACGDVHINIEPGQKGVLTIPSTVVGAGNKPFVVRMHNNWGTTYTGTVTVSKPIPTVAELTEADYLALLDAVQLNDLTEGNLYLKSVQANLTDLLEEIHTKYGADVPTSIRNHKNYINYAAPTTYENWDYGTSTRTIVNQDGLELLQLTADSAGEISIITRSFERTSNNTKFLINIYNNQSYDVRVDIHNGYAAWAAGGANTLKANSWTTITLEKSSFAAADEVAFIFMGNEVGSTYLVSPVYDYAFDSELTGDVLYNDTITIRENGWNAATKAATKFGETYKADIADSSVEDPEWKCSLLYLSNTTTVDATKYSYVKFYLYNATDLTLFLSLKNIPSQYNFDESGNTVPMNEWKEFLIPVETWNAQNSNHLELIFGSNQVAHHGTIYVSQFVGVAK